MSLVTAATLAARLGVPVSDKVTGAVEAGEAAVLAWLGAETLATANQSVRVRQTFDRDTLALPEGILTSLTTLTEDGVSIDIATIVAKYWWLEQEDLKCKFRGGKLFRAEYVTGWANEAALPAPIREAVLLASSQVYNIDMSAGGLVKTGESLADWSVSYTQMQTVAQSAITSLPVSSLSLLGKYKRPGV